MNICKKAKKYEVAINFDYYIKKKKIKNIDFEEQEC